MFYRTTKLFHFLIIIIFLLNFQEKLFAQQKDPLKNQVTITLPPDSLITSLKRLEQKAKCNFAFDPDQLRKLKNKELKFAQTPLSTILEKLFFGTSLEFNLVGNDIVITPGKQITWTIHGYVRDSYNGEELIGATVQIPALHVGITTNRYGFYSISIPQGEYEMIISNAGYQPQQKLIHLDRNKQEQIELSLKERPLEEVVITKSATSPNPILLNEANFTAKQLNNAAYYLGETDAMKRLQMENGIKSLTEGSSGLFIRGGNADQNLILLDEAIIYNPSHLYGLVSVFNSDVVNNIQVYKDYMPTNFGGRLSSVIVNRMTEGNSKEFHLSGGVNLMSLRFSAEGPIVKDKGSFIVAYRRSMLDVFHRKFKLFNPNSVYNDINAKANYKLNKNNSIFYSVYVGNDNLLSENSYSNKWGNLTSTLRWNHIINSKIFLNASAIYSNYSNLLDLNADTLSQKSQWNTGVKEITAKADFTYYRSPKNQIKFGISSIYHQFMPGEMYKQKLFEFNISREKSLESALYYSQQINLNRSFELDYGLRLSLFRDAQEQQNLFDEQGNRIKKDIVKTFFNPEPRINISYLLQQNQRLFITYNRNYQYLQLIQNSALAFSSLEPYIPASVNIKPQHANHFSVGYRYAPVKYVFSANAYYKRLNNQLDLIGHTQIISNPSVRSQLRAGNSDAYGVEIELNKTEGRFSGTIAYTYSRAFRKITDINFGNRFVANYDIPNELKLTARFELNKQISLQSFFTYTTGRPLTLPVGYYQHDGLNVPIFEGRNTSRFPDYSRLDVSAQYRLQSKINSKRTLGHTISIGIYNLYNRKNPLYYHLSSSSFEPRSSTTEYGFGFYPWVSYSFKI